MNRTYRGVRTNNSISVIVTQAIEGGNEATYPLSPEWSQRIRNHSPDGFNWGYGGSGPAQLALAILLDATNSIRHSRRLYQKFKFKFVSAWGDRWEITSHEICTWIANSGALLDQAEEDLDDTGEPAGAEASKEVPHA